MKHINIALFVVHKGCPHMCSFCNQRSISGSLNDVTPDDVHKAAETAIASLTQSEAAGGEIAFFGGINKCRFKGKVKPGDKLRLETKIIRHKGPMGVGEAVASVDGKVVAQAELTFMVGAAQ